MQLPFFSILGMNQVTLLGRCGGKPEVRGSEERPVVLFNLATHHNYRKGEGEENKTLKCSFLTELYSVFVLLFSVNLISTTTNCDIFDPIATGENQCQRII